MRSELESLTGRVDGLLGWLKNTEAQMEQETASSEDGKIQENDGRTLVWLTQKLQQVKVKFYSHLRILNKMIVLVIISHYYFYHSAVEFFVQKVLR